MDSNIVFEVKKKKEFSQLPDSVVQRVVDGIKGDVDKVKEARSRLRKYFGVFLTNKVLKGKGSVEENLRAHKSSMKRNYDEFYEKLFEKVSVKSVIDLGCGANGYSFPYLKKRFGVENYVGIEASGQVVKNINEFFENEKLGSFAKAVWLDLFDVESVKKIIIDAKKPKAIFMFQLVDALENLERDFSKRFVLETAEILNSKDRIIVTLPTESLSGKTAFKVRRNWFVDFLEEHFKILDDFVLSGERIICLSK